MSKGEVLGLVLSKGEVCRSSILTWKFVEAPKTSVLYIYIYIDKDVTLKDSFVDVGRQG